MKDSDAAVVLALCATYDQRTIGRTDAAAWGRVLGDTALEDALQAVDAWYAEHRDRIMPADVNLGARKIAGQRIGRQRLAALEAEIAAENPPAELTERERPLSALMAGTPIKSAPRRSWQERRAIARGPSKPPFTDEELRAARKALEDARTAGEAS